MYTRNYAQCVHNFKYIKTENKFTQYCEMVQGTV